jgi:uncharacterized protein with NAD-binding domain and iron-sulfur cluster
MLIAPPQSAITPLPSVSLQARLRPAASTFSNLLLAGDWVRNGINAGCAEAAVTAVA